MKKLLNAIRYYSGKYTSYHVGTHAASASFFLLSAIFPLLVLAVSIISYTPLAADDFLSMIAQLIPVSFKPLFYSIIEDVLSSNATAMGISIVALLWTAGKSMLGISDGLNAIADVDDTRNFIVKRIVCIFYTLALILGVILNLGLQVFGEYILHWLQAYFPYVGSVFAKIMDLQELALFIVLTIIFLLIYTIFPSKKMQVHLQIPGALFTAFVWIAFSDIFSLYVDYFPQFSAVYGTIGMVLLFMLWLYFCMTFIFIGAIINRLYPSIFWRAYVTIKHRFHSRYKK